MLPDISPQLQTLSPQDFVSKWSKTSLKEKSGAQEHFIDICRLVGHPTPAEADPDGRFFTFEADADKQTGHLGWADAWKQNYFAWEYKGKHKDLVAAYQQLLQYRESLGNPPLLVVSDMDRIVIHTNFTNTVKQIFEITLDELLNFEKLNLLKALFFDPDVFCIGYTPEQVTKEAATEFARLADLLREAGMDSYRIAHFLIQLLFCLFAEDIGLLPKNIFTQLITNTRNNPSAFSKQLGELFKAMSSGGWFGANEILKFNGRLFLDDVVLDLNNEGLDILVKVSALDWSNIEPSILGTLFERSLDPEKRSQLGAHYTSKEDINLIVEPVLMAPLRSSWLEVQTNVRELIRSRTVNKTKATQNKYDKQILKLLRDFSDNITQVRVLDPACGSGNFLYVALKKLLDLQKEVIAYSARIGIGHFFPSVDPAQLYGIETNSYAHELAQATIWIGYIQWLRENGFGIPSQPILKPLHNIMLMDAIVSYDNYGHPIEPEWPEADVIIGNPPFLGSKKMRPILGNNYCDSLRSIYRNSIKGLPDLVCYWFEKAQRLIAAGKVRRAGLLATQAIRGGANRQVLSHIKETGQIFLAWSDREWILDGALVHVSIIGFDNGDESIKLLNGNQVPVINADLTVGTDISTAKPLRENALISFQGVVLRGPFNISQQIAEQMLADLKNPNGRPNSDVIKPRRTGQDIVSQLSNSYVIDFGIDAPIDLASQYTMPFEFVKEHVYPMRQQAVQLIARQKWWIHWNARIQMREALAKIQRYIATPRVAKHRIFVWLEGTILPDAQLVVFARSDDYFFGVLHSKVHEIWSRRMGTQLREAESGFRYTSTTTFETFPLPWPPGLEPIGTPLVEAISIAAQELVEKRNNWLNGDNPLNKKARDCTLTQLYNQRPTWLELAHEKVDNAVLDAYRWPSNISDEEIILNLLILNENRH